tara:strand:- start:862 stop:1311 length:450 start_codon:yes stop_codon:yes gene_type:complete
MAEVGSTLRQHSAQYVAKRDNSGTWRVLNAWHSGLETFDADTDEIPDDHAAMTVLTEGAFEAVIKEATAEGVLEGINLTGLDEIEYSKLEDEINVLREQNLNLLEQLDEIDKSKSEIPKTPLSESAQLRQKGMDNILKIIGMDAQQPLE